MQSTCVGTCSRTTQRTLLVVRAQHVRVLSACRVRSSLGVRVPLARRVHIFDTLRTFITGRSRTFGTSSTCAGKCSRTTRRTSVSTSPWGRSTLATGHGFSSTAVDTITSLTCAHAHNWQLQRQGGYTCTRQTLNKAAEIAARCELAALRGGTTGHMAMESCHGGQGFLSTAVDTTASLAF
jgi:hypothetical protein